MKRKAAPNPSTPTKRKRPEVPEYHLATPARDGSGEIIWPAPEDQIRTATDFIIECAKSNERALIVPDKDTDGLASGAILHRTLVALGLDPTLIDVHLIEKGNTIHSTSERTAMKASNPSYIIILDQGSRKSPPVIDSPHKALVIDHHHAELEDFPESALFINACHSPPVVTSSLLTYLLCEPLHSDVATQCDWLCVMGTHGDLGTTLKWEAPFPDMKDTFKKYTKKALNDAVSSINAPRRTATYDVRSAWDILLSSAGPADVLKHPRLLAARREVGDEVERCTHTAPKFTPDGKVAVFRIESAAQVHPIIATRWAGHLNSNKLDFILVANSGYLPGKVNFSCRVPRCARSRDPPVDIIVALKQYAADAPSGTLVERLGEDFAHGHTVASGGIVNHDEFEELMASMRVGEKVSKPAETNGSPQKNTKNGTAKQKNTLMNYFAKPKS
ncbi:DHH family protein [Viridothelium virens]|uniref:DHH family protein n=1 Tax=Viridothelium virens TaxID=1048519 RepID=A0A6A6H982_VIRVR|nr:DHH family protein [Viridothelium virens]